MASSLGWNLAGVLLLVISACLVKDGMLLDVIGKPTSQSSTSESGYQARKAVDGDIHAITHTVEERNPWWRLDLEAVYCLKKVTIINRMDEWDIRLDGAQVRAGLSPDRLSNRLLGTIDHSWSNNGATAITFVANPVVTARYVSVDLPGENKILQLGEVMVEEFMGEEFVASTAITLNGSRSSQSSQYNDWASDRAVDRAFVYQDPHCSRTRRLIDSSENTWWKIDLGSPQCVGQIRLKSRDEPNIAERLHLKHAAVRAGLSNEPIDNTMCGSPVTEYQAVANNWMEFDCNSPDGVIARYVSVNIQRTIELALCEVLVLPCDLPKDDFTLVVNPAVVDLSGGNGAILTAYKGPNDIHAGVSFGRQLVTGGLDGLPPGSTEEDELSFECTARTLRLIPSAGRKDGVGVYYFEATRRGQKTRIQTVMLPENVTNVQMHVRPVQRTQRANTGDSVQIEMLDVNSQNKDYRWRHDGGCVIPSWNGQLSVIINDVSVGDGGIYSCFVSGQEDQQLHGIMRLIVRGCSAGMWGPPLCLNTCRQCYNGGICDDKTGSCICAPGFSGQRCQQLHGRNVFGQNARHRCSNSTDPHDEACRGRLFCLPDPYGCSCAAGYTGLDCMQECTDGTYGADCKLTCHCASGGTCSKDTGECRNDECASSYFGINCQCSSSPGEVETTTVSQRNFSLSWAEPACVFREGTALRFLYRLIDAGSGQVLLQANTTHESVTLDDLTPYTTYGFQVAVTTMTGTGPLSELLNITTSEAEPSAPVSISTQNIDDVSITVTWSSPYPPNGVIISYDIAYWKSTDAGSPNLRNDVGVTPLAYRVDGLNDSTTYHVQVRARTSAGIGPWSSTVVAFTQIGVPGFVRNLHQTNVTDRSISLAWDEPLDPMGQIASYIVEYRITEKPYDQSFVAGSEYTRTDVNDPWYRKDYCEPGTKYEFRVFAQNEENAGKTSSLEVFTKPLSDIPQPEPARTLPEEMTDTTVTIRLTGVNSIYIVAFVIRVQKQTAKAKREAFVPRHYRDSSQDYIAAEIPNTDVTVPFTVGDSLIYGGFYNAPLVTGASYRISIGAMSSVNDTEASVRFSTPITVTVRSTKKLNVAAIILGGMFAFVAVATGCVVWRTRIRHNASSAHGIALTQEHDLSVISKPALCGAKSQRLDAAESAQAFDYDQGVYEDIGLPPWARGLEIKWWNLTVEDKVLGKGNFGEVRAGSLNTLSTISRVVVSILTASATTKASEDFMTAFQTMATVKTHPNVVGLLGACLHDATLYVALEYLPNGNLRDYLRRTRQKQAGTATTNERVSPLTSSNLLAFGIDIARGMEHLSNAGIIHRDLAARNILLAEDLTAKVSDFGLSQGENIYVQRSVTRCPSRWLAIETLIHHEHKSKSDVWSYGIVLWEIATFGATPYPGIQSNRLARRLQSGYRMPKPQNCAVEIYDLMTKCWQTDPHQRPRFKELGTALQAMSTRSDENVYMYPHIYEDHVIQPEFDDN